jgi:hypothetical protein
VHRVESDLLLVRLDASEARFGAALARARRALAIAAQDGGWVRVQRLEIAWRALEIAVVVGRARELADLIVQRLVDPEPPLLDGSYFSVPARLPAICARASPRVARRCFARFRALRGSLSGGILRDTDAFTDGAERYARGDWRGAARAWRPLLQRPGLFASLLPDAMASVFARAGDVELVERLEAAGAADAGKLNGAAPVMLDAARRAAARGDVARARALARLIISAWATADLQVPALAPARRLAALP